MWIIVLEEYKPFDILAVYVAENFWEGWKKLLKNPKCESYISDVYEYIKQDAWDAVTNNLDAHCWEDDYGERLFKEQIRHLSERENVEFSIESSKWFTLRILKTSRCRVLW